LYRAEVTGTNFDNEFNVIYDEDGSFESSIELSRIQQIERRTLKQKVGDSVYVEWNGGLYWAEVAGTNFDGELKVKYDIDGSIETCIEPSRIQRVVRRPTPQGDVSEKRGHATTPKAKSPCGRFNHRCKPANQIVTAMHDSGKQRTHLRSRPRRLVTSRTKIAGPTWLPAVHSKILKGISSTYA